MRIATQRHGRNTDNAEIITNTGKTFALLRVGRVGTERQQYKILYVYSKGVRVTFVFAMMWLATEGRLSVRDRCVFVIR